MWLNMNQLIDLSMRHRSLKQPEISNLPLRGTYWLQRREVITYFSVRRLYAYVGRRIVLLIIAYKVDRRPMGTYENWGPSFSEWPLKYIY